MSERTGKIVAYFSANRQGKIQPDDSGPAALFYVTSVTNAEPEPKKNDLVSFDAPSPRKNKKGKMVQDTASSVTITTRAPEPTAEELARKARREEAAKRPKGGAKGRGRRNDKNSRDSSGTKKPRDKAEAKPGTRASTDSNRRRKPLARDGKLGRGQNKAKTSIRSKVRYPVAKDVGKNIFHFEFSNPALVVKKFIQWPMPADPKTADTSWRMSKKNQNFFLTKTLAPLYRNFEKKTLPWSAIRARREATLHTMEKSGFHVASKIVRGPWRYGVESMQSEILDSAHTCFDNIYGYPLIPASSLKQILKQVIEQNSEQGSDISKSLTEAVLGKSADIQCCILDAVPSGKIKQFSIEHCDVRTASETLVADQKKIELSKAVKSSNVMCLGDDAGFVISIAVSGPNTSREDASKLVNALGAGISSINSLGVKDPEKDSGKRAQAILF